MELGLLTLGDHLTDPVTGARQTQAERHRGIVEQAVVAERSGFTSVHLGEHHFCDYILSAPPIVLAAIAERTTHLRLSTGVLLSANLDPVRVAEDYATLDLISGGRVEPVLGRGSFFPHTFAGFGQDASLAKQVFAENVELLVRLWSTENLTWSGTYHKPLANITTQPRPLQTPRPPMWVGAGTSLDSIELAARLGLGLMLPTVFGKPEDFRPMVDHYRAKWEEHGHDPRHQRVAACSHAWVAKDSAAARKQWEPRYKTYIDWVNQLIADSTGRPDISLGVFDFEDRCRTTAVCGSPAEMAHRINEIADILGLDTYLLKFDMGGMPYPEIAEAIALCGSEVLPQLM